VLRSVKLIHCSLLVSYAKLPFCPYSKQFQFFERSAGPLEWLLTQGRRATCRRDQSAYKIPAVRVF